MQYRSVVTYHPGGLQLEVKVKVSLRRYIYATVNQPVTFRGIGHTQLKQSHISPGRIQHTSYAGSLRHSVTILFPHDSTHHCRVCRGSMEWAVCPTFLHMTSSGDRTSDFWSTVQSTCSHPWGHNLKTKMLPQYRFCLGWLTCIQITFI